MIRRNEIFESIPWPRIFLALIFIFNLQVVISAFGLSPVEAVKDVLGYSKKVICVTLFESNLHSHAFLVITNGHDSG